MKKLLLIFLLMPTLAHAINTCPAQFPVARSHHHNSQKHCLGFSVFFPWELCQTRICWRGPHEPPTANGNACGTRVFCVRLGRSNRFYCGY